MILNFTKMNGAGNDFVVIDNLDLSWSLTKDQIARLCDRHRGVGADGLLAVEPAEQGADVKFRYYNADGGEAEMCGNGARCFGRYVSRLLGGDRAELTFETIAGTLRAEMVGEEVSIEMSEPFGLELNSPVEIDSLGAPVHHLNTGVPHAVAFVDDVEKTDIIKNGAALRYHDHFQPNGTNANFAQALTPDHLSVRTYERGVEGETLACGTGITACALLHNLLTGAPSPIKITVRGGDDLIIAFEPLENQGFAKVTMTGPADFVFNGQIEV
ncbi:diaminopimelate epimerase [Akkermansiaceae bacterium]|nr:diaminopimelate epimerase [Akkermansiaceae bacterium]MDB4508455.1 diaminopimelate epimerase [Akkermansiaceae bacterium]MDB4541394.1 diaminopimelate epimerase [Akkermansiaceae bacterium]